MLCSQLHLRKDHEDFADVKLLPCRSWGCDLCAPNRRNQLKAVAAAGEPNACLTLTIKSNYAESTVHRYQALHGAWKSLVKRIIRQFRLVPAKRWLLTSSDGYPYQSIRSYAITTEVPADAKPRCHYMAFNEETEAGEPHLHILLRMPFIPQDWLSQQMAELIDSPVVWIEKIKGAKSAIKYVAKYVAKAPAQFGKSRRYWISKWWRVNTPDEYEAPLFDRRHSQLVRKSFRELRNEIIWKGLIPVKQTRTIIRLFTARQALKRYGPGETWSEQPDLVNAYQYLQELRSQIQAEG